MCVQFLRSTQIAGQLVRATTGTSDWRATGAALCKKNTNKQKTKQNKTKQKRNKMEERVPRFVLLEKNNRGLHRKARKHRHESKDRMRRNSVKKKNLFSKKG